MQIKNNPNHAPLGAPDHSVISFCFNLYSENIPRSTRYSYEQVDYMDGLHDLSIIIRLNQLNLVGQPSKK